MKLSLKTIRKTLLPILIVIPLLFSCDKSSPKPDPIRPVKISRVLERETLSSIPLPGITRAESRVNLSFRVNGPLVAFPVSIGDVVKRGDLLAQIDPRDFSIRVQNTQGALEQTQAELTFAESDLKRVLNIQQRDPGAISQSDVDRKLQNKNRLDAELLSRQAELLAAKNALSYTELLSPFDGRIVAKFVDNYEYVREKQSVVRILDISKLEMIVDLSESMITELPQIGKVEITLDSFPDLHFSATIKEVGTEPSQITRTYPVTLLFTPSSDHLILAGMTGVARFFEKILNSTSASAKTQRLQIPLSALVPDKQEGDYVWIVNSQTSPATVHKRRIEVDQILPTGVTVTKGLTLNDIVVSAGAPYLREGQQVRLLDFTQSEGPQ